MNPEEIAQNIIGEARNIFQELQDLPLDIRVETLNRLKLLLFRYSPFKQEPVDCVLWVPIDDMQANDYNPNKVAPPEMTLLEHSIMSDGYTQPIVTWPHDGKYEVIDGFHRNRIGRESEAVQSRIMGYLPVVQIKPDREGRNDRIASTIRHNRARGKHQIDSMSDIVVELKKRNWSNNRICKELGMDEDEVLRLCQISGLTDVFSDSDFSEAWDAEIFTEDSFNVLDEEDIT